MLNYLSCGIYEDDVPAFRKRLAERNVVIVGAPPHALDDSGLCFHDDDGNLIELRVAEKCSPDAKATASNPSTKKASSRCRCASMHRSCGRDGFRTL